MKFTFTFLLIASIISQSFAQAGTPDNAFATNGKVITSIGASVDFATAIAVQSDGKIIAAGTSQDENNAFRFALVRYNTNGTPDNTFGTNGKVTTNLQGQDDEANAIAIQSDGKIVVAGSSAGSFFPYQMALVRYTTNGALDTTFGFYRDGRVLDGRAGYEYANAIAIQSDGKIVAAGSSSGNNYTSRFALFRYNTDGNRDTTFGTNGYVTTAFGINSDRVQSIAIQSDGKIVAAGVSFGANNGSSDIALARYNPNGSLDNTFGTNGKLTTFFGTGRSAAYAIGLQNDGKIVVAGDSSYQLESSSSFALLRYNTNGTLDNSFDGDGKVTTTFGASDDIGRSLAIQSDGKLVVAGYTTTSDYRQDFALARYTTTGALDATFNGTGKASLNFGKNDICYAMKLFGNHIYLGGYTDVAGTPDFALAAFKNDATAMPLSLTSFTAFKQNTSVQLIWKIAGEQNTSVFEIERSTDGEKFRKIGAVDASGVSISERAYAFTDDIKSLSQFGTIFYRLRMLDADGKFTYSPVMLVKSGAIVKGLQIFSNPVKDVLHLQVSGTNETAILQITDAAGRLVKQEKVQLNGTTSISSNIQSLTNGNYYLLLLTRDKKLVQPFVKQ